MFVPEEVKAFEKKTLIVACDHVHARLYLADDREVHFVHELKTDYPGTDGDRTSMVAPSGLHSAEQPEKDSIIGETHLFHALARDLHERFERHEYEELVIAAGQEVHELEVMLHPDVLKCVKKFIPKLLVKMELHELLHHLA